MEHHDEIYIHPIVKEAEKECVDSLSVDKPVAENEPKLKDYQLTEEQIEHFYGDMDWLKKSKESSENKECGGSSEEYKEDLR